jgi:hypothetical protein
MDWWNYLAGGALFGVAAACWDKIRAAVWRVVKLLVRRSTAEAGNDAANCHTCRRRTWAATVVVGPQRANEAIGSLWPQTQRIRGFFSMPESCGILWLPRAGEP